MGWGIKHMKRKLSAADRGRIKEPKGSVNAPSRREFVAGLAGAAMVGLLAKPNASAQTADGQVNLARVAIPSAAVMTSENKITSLNDGFVPSNSFDRSHGRYALWPDREENAGVPWVQYEWSQPVTIDKVEIYWALDRPRPSNLPGTGWPGMMAPVSYRILYWSGSDFVPVEKPQGLGMSADSFNATTFDPVKTSKVRVEVNPQQGKPAGILEWRVYNYGPVPKLRADY